MSRSFSLSGMITLALVCCHKPTPQEVKATGDAACTLVAAFGGTPEEQAICATATDLAEIAAAVRASRADAGPGVKVEKCKIIPTQTVCATDNELAAAIKSRKASK